MKKSLLTLLAIVSITTHLSAQEEPEPARGRIFNHSIGVQANELIRQVFNFNNTNTQNGINNPYLLVYSLNLANSGWGIRTGVGYTYRTFTDDDGITRRETDLNVLNVRFGLEKAFQLTPKWSTGIGIDGVMNNDNNETKSTTRGFDTTVTVTTSNISSVGGGAMGWVRYNINERVQIGTEASFYYVTGDQKQEISITTRTNIGGGSTWNTVVSKVDNEFGEGIFRVPVAIYLLIRF